MAEEQDHAQLDSETYRAIDAELAEAEHEMEDVDALLAAVHERQERRRKQGKHFD